MKWFKINESAESDVICNTSKECLDYIRETLPLNDSQEIDYVDIIDENSFMVQLFSPREIYSSGDPRDPYSRFWLDDRDTPPEEDDIWEHAETCLPKGWKVDAIECYDAWDNPPDDNPGMGFEVTIVKK